MQDFPNASSPSQSVIEVFLADTAEQLGQLRTLLADGDLEGVQRVAHYLKGSAMCLGLERMCELCEGIEVLSLLAGVQGANKIVPLLESEVTRLRDELTGCEQKT